VQYTYCFAGYQEFSSLDDGGDKIACLAGGAPLITDAVAAIWFYNFLSTTMQVKKKSGRLQVRMEGWVVVLGKQVDGRGDVAF
jgi:hypothetical protein